MENFLKKLSEIFFVFNKYIMLALIIEMVIVIIFNTFGRYVLNSALHWTEEITRYSFVWATFLGAACAYKQRGLIGVSFVIDRINPKFKLVVSMIVETIVGIFLIMGIIYGTQMTILASGQTAPVSHIPMSFIYVSIPISCTMMLVSALYHLLVQFREKEALVNWGENW